MPTRFRVYHWATVRGTVERFSDSGGFTIVLGTDDGRTALLKYPLEGKSRALLVLDKLGEHGNEGLRIEAIGLVEPLSTRDELSLSNVSLFPYGAQERNTRRRAEREERTYEDVAAEEDSALNPAA